MKENHFGNRILTLCVYCLVFEEEKFIAAESIIWNILLFEVGGYVYVMQFELL